MEVNPSYVNADELEDVENAQETKFEKTEPSEISGFKKYLNI